MFRRMSFLSAVAAALSFAMPVAALEPSAIAARAGVTDAMLARSALAALDSDPVLRDVSIVVSVVDRQAVIGGAVPTPELAQRAEAIVRQATGIEVKNRCFVQSRPDPLIRAVADRLNPTARLPRGHDLPSMVVPPRPRSLEDVGTAPPTAVAAAPAPPPPTPVVSMKIASSTPVKPTLLQEPTAAPVGPRYASLPPVPTVSPVPTRLTTSAAMPMVAPVRQADVMGTLLELRKSEARFAGLTVEVREGTVYLAGTSPRDSDAWDFADRVRRVPGVRAVVMGTANRK